MLLDLFLAARLRVVVFVAANRNCYSLFSNFKVPRNVYSHVLPYLTTGDVASNSYKVGAATTIKALFQYDPVVSGLLYLTPLNATGCRDPDTAFSDFIPYVGMASVCTAAVFRSAVVVYTDNRF